MPRKLSDQIKREEYLTREIIIEQEKLLAQTAGTGGRQSGQLHAALKNDLFAGAAELSTEGGELLRRRASRRAAGGANSSAENSSPPSEEETTTTQVVITNEREKTTEV